MIALLDGCADRGGVVSPDSTHGANDNLVHVCAGGVNPLGKHLPGQAAGVTLVGDTATVALGGTTQTVVNVVRARTVLPPMYGQATVIWTGQVQYVPPARCTGVDTMWYVGVRDTGLLVVRILNPVLASADSTDVVPQEVVTRTRITPSSSTPWTSPRIIGFAGSSHGTLTIVDDYVMKYLAPSDYHGVDSVNMIVEADLNGVTLRDTALVQFNVLQRGTPPGPYDVTPIGPTGSNLVASHLSSDGRVAGTATLDAGVTHAFKWTNGVYTDLGPYNGSSTVGVGINSSGDVAGYAKTGVSTSVGLIWKADGSVVVIPQGAPISIGITDGGAVVAGGSYLVDGQFVRTVRGAIALNDAGDVLSCYLSGYQTCGLTDPLGHETFIDLGHGTYPVLMNDSSDVWVSGRGGSTMDYHDVFFEHVATNGTKASRTLNSVFPELVPFGDSSVVGAQTPLALDDRRNLLETNLLVTSRGAFVIDDLLADRTWHLVQAIAMNDRGQILAIARNGSAGTTSLVLLTRR